MKSFALTVALFCLLSQSAAMAFASDEQYPNNGSSGAVNAGNAENEVPVSGAWQDTAATSSTNGGAPTQVVKSAPVVGTNTTSTKYSSLPATATSSSVSLNVVDNSNMAANSPSPSYIFTGGALGSGSILPNLAPVIPVLVAPLPVMPVPVMQPYSSTDGSYVTMDNNYSYTDDDYGTDDDY